MIYYNLYFYQRRYRCPFVMIARFRYIDSVLKSGKINQSQRGTEHLKKQNGQQIAIN